MSQLKIFSSQEFGKIQLTTLDNKEYFSATSVAKALGYSNPHDAINRHCKKDGVVKREVIDSIGRKQEMNFISEGNVYRLITKSKLPSAERFESWLFEEVLPSIRKYGGYFTPEKVEEVLLNPDTIIQLAIQLKEERGKRFEVEKQLEKNIPKVIFAQALETSQNTILIGELAKILKQNGLNIGQNRLFERLRKEGYLGNKGDYYNLPTQKSMDLRLFEIKVRTVNNADGSVRVTKTTKVTGKGQIYFINKFAKEPKVVKAS